MYLNQHIMLLSDTPNFENKYPWLFVIERPKDLLSCFKAAPCEYKKIPCHRSSAKRCLALVGYRPRDLKATIVVLVAIIFINRKGLRWPDAPKEDVPLRRSATGGSGGARQVLSCKCAAGQRFACKLLERIIISTLALQPFARSTKMRPNTLNPLQPVKRL